jgi:hypothetical protein
MPFKSKSQIRLFKMKERRGELPEGTVAKWMTETPNPGSLPRVKQASFVRGLEDELSKLASKIPMSISKQFSFGKIPIKRFIRKEEIIDQATKPAVTDTIVQRTMNVAKRRGVPVSQVFNQGV